MDDDHVSDSPYFVELLSPIPSNTATSFTLKPSSITFCFSSSRTINEIKSDVAHKRVVNTEENELTEVAVDIGMLCERNCIDVED